MRAATYAVILGALTMYALTAAALIALAVTAVTGALLGDATTAVLCIVGLAVSVIPLALHARRESLHG